MKSYIERTLEFHELYKTEILPAFRAYEVYRKNAESRLKSFKYGMLAVCIFCTSLVIAILAGLLEGNNFITRIFEQLLYASNDNFAGMFILTLVIIGTAVISALWVPTAYYYYAKKQRKAFSLTLKHDCLDKILKVFGDIKWVQQTPLEFSYNYAENSDAFSGDINYAENNTPLISDEDLEKSGLFTFYNYRADDDSFEGTYNGVTFKITETDLQHRSRNGAIDVFKGVIISFNSNKKIKNRTIISTKGDITKQNEWIIHLLILLTACLKTITADISFWSKAFFIIVFGGIYLLLIKKSRENTEKFDEMKLEDSRFSRKFNAFSSDQVEGRYLLTTAFIERFQNLNTAFGAKRAKCSFFKNNIMIAIQTKKNLFELGSLDKTLEDPDSINDFYNEISSILKMVDYFKLDEKTGL